MKLTLSACEIKMCKNECPICYDHIRHIGNICKVCNYVWCFYCEQSGSFERCPFCRSEISENSLNSETYSTVFSSNSSQLEEDTSCFKNLIKFLNTKILRRL